MHPTISLLLLASSLSSGSREDTFAGIISRWQDMDAVDPTPADAVLFVGSSSIRRWESMTSTFGDYKVIQRGFGGSNWSDLVDKADEIVVPYDPAAIVAYGGSNILATGGTPAQLFQDYLDFVDKVHTLQNQNKPPITIITFGLTPTPAQWGLWPQMSEFNQLVQANAETDPTLIYIDTPSIFLATGSPPSLTLFCPDQQHLNAAGYAIWANALRPVLESVLAPNETYVVNTLHPPRADRILVDFGPLDGGVNGTPTASPDANGNSWQNWWNPTGANFETFTGEHIGDLQDVHGVPTGVELLITGSFYPYGLLNGGLTNPSPALLGRLAIGTATQDFFSCDTLDSPGGFMLGGLDPKRAYDLRFFASQNHPQTRITSYTVTGAKQVTTTLQVSGAGSNSNPNLNYNNDTIASVLNMHPDPFGRIFVDLGIITGDKALIGVLELGIHAPEPRAFGPIGAPTPVGGRRTP